MYARRGLHLSMIRISRNGATLAAAAALLLATAQPPPAWAAAPAQPASAAAPPAAWPQASSDLRADPDIRFGLLPNGMRYAIKRQTIPAGQGALRLWIGAGALQETDAQQ